MSVMITITVSPTGAAEVQTGADATAEAPPPSLLGGLGGTLSGEAAEEAGPAPLEPRELGLGAAVEAGEQAGGPPPEDFVVAGEAADTTAGAPEPRPVEELE